jgi:hypothetical protein
MRISIYGFPCHAIESTMELEMMIEKLINQINDKIQAKSKENMLHEK